jgi:hypothetical protein
MSFYGPSEKLNFTHDDLNKLKRELKCKVCFPYFFFFLPLFRSHPLVSAAEKSIIQEVKLEKVEDQTIWKVSLV